MYSGDYKHEVYKVNIKVIDFIDHFTQVWTHFASNTVNKLYVTEVSVEREKQEKR